MGKIIRQAVRERLRDIPIFVIVESADDAAVSSALAVGTTDIVVANDFSQTGLVNQVKRHLQAAHAAATSLKTGYFAELSDWMALPVILVDERAGFMAANLAGERLLDASAGLVRDRTDTIRGDRPEHNQTLFNAVQAIHEGRADVIATALPRDHELQPLQLLVLGVKSGADRLCALVVGVPEDKMMFDIEILRNMFGLTNAEARVARQLAQGMSMEEVANALSISVGTARSQLKEVFRKTDCRRQSELVRLLLSSPAGWVPIGDD